MLQNKFLQKLSPRFLLAATVAIGVLLVGALTLQGSPDLVAAQTAKDQPFTFAAVGDFGARTQTERLLQSIGSSNLDYTLALGDLGFDRARICGLHRLRVFRHY